MPTKLPLWRTIIQAEQALLNNLSELLRLSRIWMLLMIPGLTAVSFWQASYITEAIQALGTGKPHQGPAPMNTLLVQTLSAVIMLPALSSIAVAWHRLLLRREHVSHAVYLRFDEGVIGYAMLLFMIGLISLAPQYISLIFQALGGTGSGIQRAIDLAFGPLAFLALLIPPRLSLVLPARALGRNDITFGAAWRVTRHNTWRLFWAYVLCMLPWVPMWALMMAGLNAGLSLYMQHESALVVVGVLGQLMWLLASMSSVGVLSIAYRHFIEGGPTEHQR